MDPRFIEHVRTLQARAGVIGSPEWAEARVVSSPLRLLGDPFPWSRPNLVFPGQLENGTYVVVKAPTGVYEPWARAYGQRGEETLIHECAAWQLAKRLGPPYVDLVPPAVHRPLPLLGRDVDGIVILAVPGESHETDPFAVASDQCRAAGLFDALLGQQDRHGRSWLWDEAEWRLHLIDQGYAFARAGDFCADSRFVAWRHVTGASRLIPEELGALEHLLASGELDVVGELLDPERAACLIERAARMLSDEQLLPAGDFWGSEAIGEASTITSEASRAGELTRIAAPRPAHEATRHMPGWPGWGSTEDRLHWRNLWQVDRPGTEPSR